MNYKNEYLVKNIEAIIRKQNTNKTALTKLTKGLVTQSSLSKFINYPEESNPTVKFLCGLANASKTEPWMFLMQEFPFEIVTEKPLLKISKEGYVLLHAFEQASKNTKIDILKQLGYLLKSYDENKNASLKLEETAKKYLIT